MRAVALLVAGLGLVSAAAGIAVAVVGFAPIPFGDFIAFFRQFFDVGGWDGYRLGELYAQHNEHRLVIPRLWFLADLALFDGTQAFLIVVTVLSSVLHAVVLTLVFRDLGHRGPLLAMFGAMALGAVLSPAQSENLVWGFQVQFIQVWLFATLALVAVSRAAGHRAWWPIAAAVVAGLASTYSMANGLLVWPLLVALALWCRVRGGPLWLLLAVALATVWIEAAGFHAHPGHGDPMQTIGHPVLVLRYAFRYLASGIQVIGTLGQEIVGGATCIMIVAMAVEAVLRPGRYRPAHAVLLMVAAFVVGSALLTALGRVTFGLGQANAGRYATPSFVFLLVSTALILDRVWRVDRVKLRAVTAVGSAVLLLVPGLVEGKMDTPNTIGGRDARVNAIVVYLAGGKDPETLHALFPFAPAIPLHVLQRMDAANIGPFAMRSRYLPPPSLISAEPSSVADECRGNVDRAVSGADGLRVDGWAAAKDSRQQPEWIAAFGESGRVVGWGAGRVRRDDVGRAIGQGWQGRGFRVAGREGVSGQLTLVAMFDDGRLCRLGPVTIPASG